MTLLGTQFALLILLSGSGEEFLYRLSLGCKRLEWEKHLAVFLTPVEEPENLPASRERKEDYELVTTGMDRMGIVYHVSRLLADNGINIADMVISRDFQADGTAQALMVLKTDSLAPDALLQSLRSSTNILRVKSMSLPEK